MPASRKPIVIAHHIMWTAYGWWLPNDPRGFTSRIIKNDLIKDLGGLHFGRKRSQPASIDLRVFYSQASQLLQHPLLAFQANDFKVIAESFAIAFKELRYTCYACASRLPMQKWEFVQPYDNWPLHVGHSVVSPYVRATGQTSD